MAAGSEDVRRLKKDKRSGFAAIFTVLAWLPVVVGVGMMTAPGTQYEARENPLYWLPMLPFGWWAVALLNYDGWAVRSIRGAQAAGPVAAALVALIVWRGGGSVTEFVVAAGVSLVAAVIGWISYTDSLLQRQGPLR